MPLEEIFSYVETRAEAGEPDFKNTYTNALALFRERYRRYYPLLRPLEQTWNVANGRTRTDILFVGIRFADIILSASKHYRVKLAVQGERDLRWCIQHKIPPVIAWKWRIELSKAHSAYESGDPYHLYLQNIIAGVETALHRLSPRAVVLENDSLFMERALVLAARNLRIPTFTIQHGLFMKAASPHILDGHSTDYMLVWGDFFRKLYVDKGILSPKQIEILGYPYLLTERHKSPTANLNASTACIFGQPFEAYDETLREPRYSMVANIVKACETVAVAPTYRPHPAENRGEVQRRFPTLTMTDPLESLQKTIETHDIFFSLTSTALIEAALLGKIAVQVLHDRFVADNFEVLGVCKSIENDVSALKEYLRDVRRSPSIPSVSPAYIDTSTHPGERFREILESLAP